MKTSAEIEASSKIRSIDLTIKLILILLLLVWCAMIILPFAIPFLWGIILALTLFPLYKKLFKLVRQKPVTPAPKPVIADWPPAGDPMPGIFLGAIGGMMMSGFIGLFTGAIVLSLGYKLMTAWLSGGIKAAVTVEEQESGIPEF